jgi:hypothetical protein
MFLDTTVSRCICFLSACVSWCVRLFLEYEFLGLHVFLCVCVSLSACVSLGVFVFLDVCVSRCMSLDKFVSWGMNFSRCNNYALIVNTTELVCIVLVRHVSA